MANTFGSVVDAGPGLPAPAVTGDQSDFEGVPGHGTPLHPGFNANKANFRKSVAGKHKSFQREQTPTYRGGRGGHDGTR